MHGRFLYYTILYNNGHPNYPGSLSKNLHLRGPARKKSLVLGKGGTRYVEWSTNLFGVDSISLWYWHRSWRSGDECEEHNYFFLLLFRGSGLTYEANFLNKGSALVPWGIQQQLQLTVRVNWEKLSHCFKLIIITPPPQTSTFSEISSHCFLSYGRFHSKAVG